MNDSSKEWQVAALTCHSVFYEVKTEFPVLDDLLLLKVSSVGKLDPCKINYERQMSRRGFMFYSCSGIFPRFFLLYIFLLISVLSLD